MATYTIGVDIGGTNTVFGLLDASMTLVRKIKQPTEAFHGTAHVLDRTAAAIRRLAEDEGIPISAVTGAGLGVPGFVDPEQGVCRFAGNLRWRDVPVVRELEERLGLPVTIDNDVRMYVYGEAMHGAGRGYETVLGVTLGTGLAAALVVRGELFYGGGFMAGELGHIRMEGESAACGCGMHGCLETVASATGIARMVREAVRGGRESVVREWHPDEALTGLTAADISRGYDMGDEVCRWALRHAGTLLGRGLSYAAPLYSPDLIMIGGGMAQAGGRLMDPMREEFSKLVHPMYAERIVFASAEHNDNAGVIGSAARAARRNSKGD